MATAKSVSVQVGSKKVDPYHVTVQQRSNWHHRFEIAVSSDKMEGEAITIGIDKSIEHVGKIAEINIKCTDTALIFKGVITTCLLYTSPSPRDLSTSRMPSSA